MSLRKGIGFCQQSERSLWTPFQFVKNSLQLQCLYREVYTHENSNNIWNF